MSRVFHNPIERFPGVQTRKGPMGDGPSTGSAADTSRSPLVDLYPGLRPLIGGGAGTIAVPAGTYAAGAAFPLWDVAFAQDMMPFRFWADLCSPDVTPADAVNFSGWGARDGSGAAIVIGTDLFPAGAITWANVACPVPGVETTFVSSIMNNVMWWSSFPSGNKSDTIPNTRRPADSTSPQAFRLLQGRRFQAALFVRKAQIATAAGAGAAANISAKAMVGCWLAETHTSDRLRV